MRNKDVKNTSGKKKLEKKVRTLGDREHVRKFQNVLKIPKNENSIS
jgi:hypothetical protein